MDTITCMTFYRCRGYCVQLIPKPLQCGETTSLWVRWDLQDPSWCLQWTNCQISLTGPIYILGETDVMNTSSVQPPCNIQVLQVHEDPPETWLETNFDIRMHCKFCCYEFQTASWYGRHLRSKHPECSVASGASHDELLQYSQDQGRVQQNSHQQSRQNSGRPRKRARSISDICNNLLARVTKCDRGTGSELLAIAATTEKVLVA